MILFKHDQYIYHTDNTRTKYHKPGEKRRNLDDMMADLIRLENLTFLIHVQIVYAPGTISTI